MAPLYAVTANITGTGTVHSMDSASIVFIIAVLSLVLPLICSATSVISPLSHNTTVVARNLKEFVSINAATIAVSLGFLNHTTSAANALSATRTISVTNVSNAILLKLYIFLGPNLSRTSRPKNQNNSLTTKQNKNALKWDFLLEKIEIRGSLNGSRLPTSVGNRVQWNLLRKILNKCTQKL